MTEPVRKRYFINVETGMVRAFWRKPRHGLWKHTARTRECPPIGRAAMALSKRKSSSGSRG